jgi:hypothetical protein
VWKVRFSIRLSTFVLTATLAALFLCIPTSAQVNTGRISGAVTDQTGGAIGGAKVTVVDVARGQNRDLVADAAGEYAAPNLLPGIYTVRAEFMGFETVNRENVQITAGGDVRVDITLQPGQQNQTVTVTEALPIVNTTNSQTGGTLDQNSLANLPINGRNYRWQSNYVPGVMVGVGEGSSNQVVNGTPVTNGMWNMIFDGLYSSTYFTLETNAGGTGEGGDSTLMPLDAIQEVQVVLNPKAEFGWAPGVTENIALKSGTNNLHGSAYAYGRETALDAKNPIVGATAPVAFEQFGGSAGGPIKKDKIFFFGSYEGERVSTTSSFSLQAPTLTSGAGTTNSIPDAIAAINAAAVPLSNLSLNLVGCNTNNAAIHMTTGAAVAAACTGTNALGAPGLFGNFNAGTSSGVVNTNEQFPESGGSNNGLFKLDYHINDHHTLYGSIYMGRYSEYVVPNSSQNFTEVYYEELLGVESDMGRVVEIWTPNSTLLNEARVGIDHANRPVTRGECSGNGDQSNPAGAGASTGGVVEGVTSPNYLASYGMNTQFSAGCGIPTITITGFTGKLGFANNRIDWEDPISGADSLSWTHGKHQFKFGTDIRAENFYGAKVLDGLSGTATFGATGFAAFASATPLEDFLAGAPSSETIRYGVPSASAVENGNVRHITNDKLAFFAQDDWRIVPRVTLNLGFRWEGETPQRDQLGYIATFAPGTPSGMIQNNQGFPFQNKWEPRLGFAWDTTGSGRTVVRGGGGIMYMIPQLMNYIAGGSTTTADWGTAPTGATLYLANGSPTGNTVAAPGTIRGYLIAPTAVTNAAGTIISGGGLPWTVNPGTTPIAADALFPLSTLNTAACGNGQPLQGQGTSPTGPFGSTGANPLNPPQCTGQGYNPNVKLFPYAFWNLNIQHAFTNNISLDIGYVGSRTWNLIANLNENQPFAGISGNSSPTASTTNGIQYLGELAREPYNCATVSLVCTTTPNNGLGVVYPWFGAVNVTSNGGGSNYASLQTNLTVRNYHGLTVNANYTFSHALVQLLEQGIACCENGNNTLDAADHFTFTASYAIPTVVKLPGQILQGWAVNASINMLSGLPLALTDSKDDVAGFGSSVGDRWDLYGDKTPFNQILGGAGTLTCYGVVGSAFAKAGTGCITVPDGTGSAGMPTFVSNLPAPCQAGAAQFSTSNGGQWNIANNPSVPVTSKFGYNGYAQLALLGCYVAGGSAMTPPAQGTFGDMYSSELRGKGYGLLNLSVTKDWKFKERYDAQFRWEVFNALNRTQYAAPGVNLGTPSALGEATTTPDVTHGNAVVGSGGPREMQLALRLTF